MFGAALDFDCDVTELRQQCQLSFVRFRMLWIVRYKRDHGRVMARPDPPKMQVRDRIAVHFKLIANPFHQSLIGHSVDENCSRLAQKAISPAQNHACADKAHDWVHERPARQLCCDESGDRQHRSQGVGQDMNIGRAEIEVAVVVMIVMMVVMAIMVMMPS